MSVDESSLLIIGSGGQLGTALRGRYPAASAVDWPDIDLADAAALAARDWSAVRVVVNAAAFTNVDAAETDDGRVAAWQVNAVGARNLAELALRHDLIVVHISTDYVFDGTNEQHTEDERLAPLGVYGQSKAAGDLAIGLVPKHYLLRTSWVIGEGKNFVRTMISLGRKGVAPSVVGDQVGRLTFTDEIVRAIDHLLAANHPYGTYNVTNSGPVVSWAEVARTVYGLAGFTQAVTDVTTEQYFRDAPDAAPRPLHSAFDLGRLHASGFRSVDWPVALERYVEKELAQ